MKRALIAASVASHIEQFCMNDATLLRELGYEVDVACNFERGNACSAEKVAAFLRRLDAESYGHTQIGFDRSAAHLGAHIRAYRQLRQLIDENGYDLIHCHTPIGGAICRAAARKTRKHGTKVLYTAHGLHFYTGAPLKNWLLFYPVEKLCAYWTDVLITINREDYERAKRKLRAREVEYIPGVGIDLARFYPGRFSQEEIAQTRALLGVGPDEKLLLSVGELIPRKNHQTAIRALAKLQNRTIKYAICGCGQLEGYLQDLISELKLTEQVMLLGYRSDVDRLYASADLFVFPSCQEGLPVALMEALALGLPVVCSDIRGNAELTEAQERFRPRNVRECTEKIRESLADFSIGGTGMRRTNLMHTEEYSRQTVAKKMKQIYETVT